MGEEVAGKSLKIPVLEVLQEHVINLFFFFFPRDCSEMFLSISYKPDTVLNSSRGSYLVLTITSMRSIHRYFTDEATEAKRGSLTCPRSHSK